MFRKNGEIVWDRRARIDKIFGSGDQSGAAKEKNTKNSKRKHKSKQSNSEDFSEDNESNEEPILTQFQWPEDFQVQRISSYRYAPASEQWVPVFEASTPPLNSAQLPERSLEALKIVTYNVLNDMLDHERFDRVLHVLVEASADVVLLQEVTNEFLQAVLQHPFLQATGYYLTQTQWWGVNDHGLRVLSRFPIVQTVISKSQRQLGAVVKVETERSDSPFYVKLLNVHLTSRYHEVDEYTEKQGISKRTHQVECALAAINFQHSRDTLPMVAGDFNFADGTEEAEVLGELLKQYNMVDAWNEKLVHSGAEAGTDDGFTFNPATNELSAERARHKEPRRIDRILLSNYSNRKQFKVQEMVLIGNSHEPTPPSDHYGLSLTLQLLSSPAAIFTHEKSIPFVPSELHSGYSSALCLIPNEIGPLYTLVQNLREKYDPSFERWPPHINIMFPFVKDDGNNFIQCSDLIAKIFAEEKLFNTPLKIIFDRFGIFEHRSDSYVFLFPDVMKSKDVSEASSVMPQSAPKIMLFPNDIASFKLSKTEQNDFEIFTPADTADHPLQVLYAKLREILPQCGDKWRDILVPHLTIGKFSTLSEAKSAARALQEAWKPIKCSFTALDMISRKDEDRFTIKQRCKWSSEEDSHTKFTREAKFDLAENFRLKLVEKLSIMGQCESFWLGSFRLQTDTAESDMDLSILLHEEADLEFVSAMIENSELSNPTENEYLEMLHFPVFRCYQTLIPNRDQTLLYLARFEEVTTKALQFEVGFANIPGVYSTLTGDQIFGLANPSLLAVSGIKDAEAFEHVVRSGCDSELRVILFRKFCKLVKKWANLRGFDKKAFGFPPSIAWTIMAVYAFRKFCAEELTNLEFPTPNELFIQFLGYFSEKSDWNPLRGQAIAITDESMNYGLSLLEDSDEFRSLYFWKQGMCILSPTFPFKNKCKHVLQSCSYLIAQEMKRTLSRLQMDSTDDEFKTLLKPPSNFSKIFFENNSEVIEFSLSSNEEQCSKIMNRKTFLSYKLRSMLSWVEAHMPHFLMKLEKHLQINFTTTYSAFIHPLPYESFSGQGNSLNISLYFGIPQLSHLKKEMRSDLMAKIQELICEFDNLYTKWNRPHSGFQISFQFKVSDAVLHQF